MSLAALYPFFYEYQQAQGFLPQVSKGDFFMAKHYDLLWLVYEPLSQFLEQEGIEAGLPRLSPGQKGLLFWWVMDEQFRNGGIAQFFLDGLYAHLSWMQAAAAHFKLKALTKILAKAEKLYQAREEEFAFWRENGGLEQADLSEFQTLDAQYSAKYEAMMARIERYIRDNIEEFCLDEAGEVFHANYSGPCQTHYPNGSLKAEFELHRGKLQGVYSAYFPSGQLEETRRYHKGQPEPNYLRFYEGGMPAYSQEHIAGQMLRCRSYYIDGQVHIEEIRNLLNEPKGAYTEWYENGQVAVQGVYKGPQQRYGRWVEYYPDGRLRFEANYSEEGEMRPQYFALPEGEPLLQEGTGLYLFENELFGNTHLRREIRYKAYQLDGLQRNFVNGYLSEEWEMQAGQQHGFFRRYYRNGRLREEERYEQGQCLESNWYPISDNPEGQIRWQVQPLDELGEAPACLNMDYLALLLPTPMSLFEPDNQDDEAELSLQLRLNAEGVVEELLSLGAYLCEAEDYLDTLRELSFEPGELGRYLWFKLYFYLA